MKKREIYEVLDSDGNLIGADDKPANNPNEIGADGTTDHNAAIGHQHFAHDFLGRFGFYMFNEGEGENTSSTEDAISTIAKEAYNYFVNNGDNPTPFESIEIGMQEYYYDFAKKIIGLLSTKPEAAPLDTTLSESELSKMIEDVVTSKIDKSLTSKKDNDILDSKVKDKLKSLINNMSDRDKGELIKHLKQ